MRLTFLPTLALIATMPVGAGAEDYGGGWAVPSLDTSFAITREAATQSVLKDILAKDLARKGRGASPKPPASQTVESRFQRSAAAQRESEASILAAIGQRQPEAVGEYRRFFASADMTKAFEDITRPYGLSANDVADTLTAYWVMGWIVANKAELPAKDAVTAARTQVMQRLTGNGLAGMDARRRQRLADDAIFNMLVLNQAWRAMAKPEERIALADATQRNFGALGIDLRSLALGSAGFTRR